MRNYLISMLTLILLIPIQSMALEPVNEAHAMFYYQIPFSTAKVAEKKHSFGFRMDHTSYQNGGMIEYQKLMKKTAAFDFKMGHEGVEGMYVSGVDFLQRYRLARAAEGEEEMAMDDEMATKPETKKPSAISKVGTDVGNTIDDLISIVPLGFAIGGAVAIVLVTGAAD
ncbi:MAG: hypothetical protein GKR93_02790 [Gammaproteobacteria bacterium]|nr:hypothetical protein [Gammaproteobacteria bacterium]